MSGLAEPAVRKRDHDALDWPRFRSSRARLGLAAVIATLPLVALIAYAAVARYNADRSWATTRATGRAELYAALLGESASDGLHAKAELARVIRLSAPPAGSVTELFDKGRLVASAGAARAAVLVGDPKLAAAFREHSATFELRGADGVQRIWGIAPVSGTPLVVAFGIPGSLVYGAAQTALERDLILAAIVVAAALGAAFLLAGRVTAPIRRLAARVGEGRGVGDDIAAIERGVDRLGNVIEESQLELGRRAERLEQVLAELRGLNEELEERVGLRTVELEEANRELEAFSYSVSHDLRAPLRAIDGFSRIVIDDYAGEVGPEGLRYLGLVRKNTQDMGLLIDGLLKFSRLGQQQLDKHNVDVETLARDLATEAALAQNGHGCPEISVAALTSAYADPALLRQVLTNLISNSVKYSSGREDAKVEIGCFDESGRTVYFVRDNGVGFDMRHADKLFQVFQRLHSDGYEGTGIGLALVDRIVRRHGGSIWADAKLDGGATFYFTLEGGTP